MNLTKIKSIHFVGIKGVAMAALAIVAKEMGKKVSGSDVAEEFPTDPVLHRFGIVYHKGFKSKHIPQNLDLVIYTGAHQGVNNVEVQEAIRRKISVLPHGKALGLFMQGKRGISVAGSHGKTTSSAMIAHILTKANLDPSFAIGCGEIVSLQTPAHAGSGEWFVAEADEYVTDPVADLTPRFLWQYPEVLLITNIDYDHPDVYKNLDEVKKAFIRLTQNVTENGIVILNRDDEESMSIVSQINKSIVTYGEHTEANFRLINISFKEGQTEFEIENKNKNIGAFTLKIPGKHNALNATGVVATLVSKGIDGVVIQDALKTFTGTKRRFELVTETNGKQLFDDYAHHPREIAATLSAARAWFPKKRIVVIFQPHTYSRTKSLLTGFAQSFNDADQVILTEIYASVREKPITGINGQLLVQETKKHHKDVVFAQFRNDVIDYLRTQTRENDLILTMGAGDIFNWLGELKKTL